MNDRDLGQRIAYWRRRRGLTQAVFADRLGRSKSWVTKVENGMRSADRLSTLDLVCEVLRVDMSALIGEDPVRRAESCLEDAEVARIQSAIEQYSLTSPVGSPSDTAALRRRVEHAWAAFEFADYDVVSLVLPGIIEEAQHAHAALAMIDRPSC